MNNKCDRCKKVFDIANLATDGGAALMMAICYKNATSLNNLSFCPECTEQYIKPALIQLGLATGYYYLPPEEET